MPLQVHPSGNLSNSARLMKKDASAKPRSNYAAPSEKNAVKARTGHDLIFVTFSCAGVSLVWLLCSSTSWQCGHASA